jgi:hypothetical protein
MAIRPYLLKHAWVVRWTVCLTFCAAPFRVGREV